MKLVCLALLIFTASLTVHAQQADPQKNVQIGEKKAGSITGKVVDSITHAPMAYVSVAVMHTNTLKPINGCLSADNGKFVIANLASGTYKIELTFLGYDHKIIDGIIVTTDKLNANTGDVRISQTITRKGEVLITARKDLIENKIDRLVFNAAADVTSQGAVATDVLRKVPLVDVDVDGNVQVAGNGNVKVLIDGKPSSIFGSNLAEALQSIPGSQIEKIEVITMPGAKYDAEGGSIINIILKKNTAHGANGSVNLSAGTRLENGSFNLNVRQGKFGFNISFSGSGHLRDTTPSTADRKSYDSAGYGASHLVQNTKTPFYRLGYQGQAGFDWDINKRNSLSGGFGLNDFDFNGQSLTNQQLFILSGDSKQTLVNTTNTYRDATNNNHFLSLDGHLNYKRTFAKKDREIDLAFYTTHGSGTTDYIQNQTLYLPGHDSVTGAKSYNNGANVETDYQADYTDPLSKKTTLDCGAKAAFTQLTSNTDYSNYNASTKDYSYDISQSPRFKYFQNVYAAYLSLTTKVVNYLDVKAGLRFEHTDLKANFNTSSTITLPSYNQWVPSLTLSHTFSNNNSLRLSYARRIQRPGYRELNPFLNAADPTNITQGNPNLQPEVANRFEAAYMFYVKKDATVTLMGFFYRSLQDLQNYVVYKDSVTISNSLYRHVAINTWQNIGLEDMYGLNMNINLPFSKKLTVRLNGALFEKYIIDNFDANKVYNTYNYRVNGNATYNITKKLTVEAFANFRSARTEVQGKYPSFSFYSLALKKIILKSKGSIGVTTTNPFNLYIDQPTVISGPNFVLDADRKIPFRSFGISFSYNFGKMSYTKQKGKGGPDDDDNSDLSAPPAPKTPEIKSGDNK